MSWRKDKNFTTHEKQRDVGRLVTFSNSIREREGEVDITEEGSFVLKKEKRREGEKERRREGERGRGSPGI